MPVAILSTSSGNPEVQVRVQVLNAIRANDRPVVVFDVDSTLLSTAGRHLAILRSFAQQSGNTELQRVAADLTPDAFGWTVHAPLQGRIALSPPQLQALEAFWFEAFFSGDFLHHDRPTAGAVAFVRTVHEAGAWVYFLTARTAETMGNATLTTLHTLGFPMLSGRFTLQLKPHAGLDDKAFKAAALADIDRAGNVVATFENEPANANLFRKRYPHAVHVLMDTVCSPGAPSPHPSLLHARDFQ